VFPDLQIFELSQTFLADILPLHRNDVRGIVAENAGRLILPQDDIIFLNEDFYGVPNLKLKRAAELHGDDNPPERIQFPYDPGSFHISNLLI
jgi:hypothetical protein